MSTLSSFGNSGFYSATNNSSSTASNLTASFSRTVPPVAASSIASFGRPITPTSPPSQLQQLSLNSPTRTLRQMPSVLTTQQSLPTPPPPHKRPIPNNSNFFSNSSGSPLPTMFGRSHSQFDQVNFDLSEFPSLGRSSSSSSTLSAPRTYGESRFNMVNKPSQENSSDFHIQNEDFPALPGTSLSSSSNNQSNITATNDRPSSSSSTNTTTDTSSNNFIDGQSINRDISSSSSTTTTTTTTTRSSEERKNGIQTSANGMVTNIPSNMVRDQFGIVGLLTFIRAAENDPSLVALAPGIDLTTLGLNLNAPDSLYPNFLSPWADGPCRPQDVDYHVPTEYLTNMYIREKLANVNLKRYGEDLLFFQFYMYGGDWMQIGAAAELFSRDWRYHKEEKVWITRVQGVEPAFKTTTYEKGTYYVFDVLTWQKVAKDMTIEYDKLDEKPLGQQPPPSAVVVQQQQQQS